MFLFLVDDTQPIEAGRLPNGEPDGCFRCFEFWNGEVSSKTFGIVLFYLRAVCMTLNLWRVEEFQEIGTRHSKFAPQCFAHEAALPLRRFANSSPAVFVAGIRAAREQIVARQDEKRESFLRKSGFSKGETAKVIGLVLEEEGRQPESVFDLVHGIMALALSKPHQDARLVLEGKAKLSLERGGLSSVLARNATPPAASPAWLRCSFITRGSAVSGWRPTKPSAESRSASSLALCGLTRRNSARSPIDMADSLAARIASSAWWCCGVSPAERAASSLKCMKRLSA